jgi:hypothetical protein
MLTETAQKLQHRREALCQEIDVGTVALTNPNEVWIWLNCLKDIVRDHSLSVQIISFFFRCSAIIVAQADMLFSRAAPKGTSAIIRWTSMISIQLARVVKNGATC